MGHIKEPEKVDNNINSEPLTEQERMMISELINSYKMSRETIDKQKNVETAFVPVLPNLQFGSNVLQNI
jgi:hypothetical protein